MTVRLRVKPAEFALKNHLAAKPSGIRPDVNHIIGSPYDFLVMLHHNDRIPQLLQLSQYLNEQLRIPRM
ncbi:hypothetical protein Barb7_03258 [Bacteroidales bacterium Barb7]|nr:hypothetical protein Barb7_03258 [Bacteroidales bacterium Barb7]